MYKLNDEKMFFDIADGQAIVINFTTGIYYGTSTLGSAILDYLLKGADTAAISSAVKALDGCPDDFDAQLGAFVDNLLQKEILVTGDTSNQDISFDSAALSDGFKLTVDEFSEVQDLILADPVHDVDVDQGWPILNDGQ